MGLGVVPKHIDDDLVAGRQPGDEREKRGDDAASSARVDTARNDQGHAHEGYYYMTVVQVGFGYDDDLTDPDELIDRYATLRDWSEALVEAGVSRVAVVHRFRRNASVVRRGVEYTFRSKFVERAVVDQRPDVVHVNGLNAPGRTWWLRRRLPDQTALVVQDHGGGVFTPPASLAQRVRRAVRRRAMSAPDGFMFTSVGRAVPWTRAGLIGSQQVVYDVIESSTSMVPVDHAWAREESGVAGDPAILWVGRLNANKDPLTVLSGFERLTAKYPAAAMTMIYGESQGESRVKEWVKERVDRSPVLRTRVRMLGHVLHFRLAAFYSAADLFVLGSHDEGSGYAVLEACACGASPVVTDIPSFRRMTAGGAIGALWTPGDAEDCARALAEAASRVTPAERRRVQDRFQSHLNWASIGRAAAGAYEDLVRR
ncbi:MAG: hypothetical protein DMF89_10125, partial [Acidobacteria bacterium]